MATNWDATRHYFENDAVAHFSTLMPDGSPHSVPVWVGVEGDRLAVFSITGSRKDKNLGRDPRVAVSVTSPAEPLDMAFIRGRVVERLEGDDAMPIVDRISQIYTGGPYDQRSGMTAFLIEPEVIWSNDYSAQ